MNVKNEISEELRSLSAVVATISRENPYQVPDGYFSDLAAMILLKTGGAGASKPLAFSVPDGYFEGFAQQMLNRIKAGAGLTGDRTETAGRVVSEPDELPAILAGASRVTPYRVPEGYFEELSPVLTVLREKNPYIVPEGYFDHLAAEIVARTMVDVTAESSVRAMADATAETSARPAAKVVSLGKRIGWWRYSAAAVVVGLILTIGWLRLQTTFFGQTAGTGGHNSNPGIVQPTVADMAQNMSKVSDEDLQNFLVDQDTTLAQPVQNNASMATLDMNDSDLKTLLGDVPDGELKQYMEEHGGALDVATN